MRFDLNDDGIALQAMDSSHVALVSLLLKESAFVMYRCDRSASVGVDVEQVVKIFKTCGNDDVVTIKNIVSLNNGYEMEIVNDFGEEDVIYPTDDQLFDLYIED